MKRPYYLFSNGRLRRHQNTLRLERATEARTPGADPDDDGRPSGEMTGATVPFPVESAESIYCFGEIDVNVERVGKMLKLFRRYLTWVQNSVFEGELTDAQFAALKAEAEDLMEPSEDSVIFWSAHDARYLERETLGEEPGETGRFL